jgi:preprotein translocase subunit SecG
MLTAAIYSLLGIQIVVCLLMILVVLMQRPKSEGLGAAFGGGMTENLFGAQTSSVLASFTRWLGGTFLFLSLMLSVLYSRQTGVKSPIQQQLMKASKSASAVAPSPAMATPPVSALATPSPASGPSLLESAAPAPSAASPLAAPSTPGK